MAKLVFDESNITLGDLEDFEDAIGIPLMDALKAEPVRDHDGNVVRHDDGQTCDQYECEKRPCKDAGRPVEELNLSVKVMKGLVWIAGRQSNPDYTIEDARNVRVTELEIVDSAADEPDPKEEAETDG